jgi:hypothetical protein
MKAWRRPRALTFEAEKQVGLIRGLWRTHKEVVGDAREVLSADGKRE